MEENTIRDILIKNGQQELAAYMDTLNPDDRKKLCRQVKDIDWSFLSYIRHGTKKVSGDIQPIEAFSCDRISTKSSEYRRSGLAAIKAGRLCLLLLAGGQGTRLGYDSPKGTYDMGITHPLYIFELLIQHTLDVVKEAQTWIPMYIMTSDINHDSTVAFFKEHDYFGYNPDYLTFFVQELNPATDFDGKLLLSDKTSIAMSPNGNGGWFSSMHAAGLSDKILASDIEWINVFAVDNVLQRIADPVFLGATIENGKGCGAKVVRKAAPDERVGAICLENGKPHIIEYYELSEEMQNLRNEDGSLAYGWGVILNYLFPIARLKNTLDNAMPLHVVKKAVPYMDKNGVQIMPEAPNAYKYETLALDLIHEMDDCMVFEVSREKEFAPVKNRTGIDSVDSARKLLVQNGYKL